ncbi:hypothetical protein E2562_016418 [Oryza meyeriana var. granulata]|uniref:Uncharacterized protein n=1 Tax=Oryza meyeriana var. granulata TaxID=110450 RepID=A0A6G1EX05_9ORYZ|nr:hypothetical protein E2562_016418 [Oryza meyeriana var. granulata]
MSRPSPRSHRPSSCLPFSPQLQEAKTPTLPPQHAARFAPSCRPLASANLPSPHLPPLFTAVDNPSGRTLPCCRLLPNPARPSVKQLVCARVSFPVFPPAAAFILPCGHKRKTQSEAPFFPVKWRSKVLSTRPCSCHRRSAWSSFKATAALSSAGPALHRSPGLLLAGRL